MAEPESKPAAEGEEEVEEVESGDEAGEVDAQTANAFSHVMQNPQILRALQDRLEGMVGTPSGYIQSLPKVVKRRLKALKKLQFDVVKLESEFYKEVHALECRYSTKYSSLFEKRKDIINAVTEPTDEECDWPSEDEKEEDELAEDMKNKAKVEDDKKEEEKKEEKKEEESDAKGVPSFWLTVFKNVGMLSDMVQDHDEPILQHLKDIVVKFSESAPMGFTLEFHFEANEYFTETLLTKQYTMRFEPDNSDPLTYEGPEIIKCKGCNISWNKGKNVTVKTVKKKQKHKGRGTTRTVTKTVQADSFFNFFNPPSVPEGDDADMDEELEELLAADFEIGHFIRERIVPRAVLFFTGEAVENEEYEEENEEEHDEDGEYNEEDDPDFNPQGDKEDKPQECKQQ